MRNAAFDLIYILVAALMYAVTLPLLVVLTYKKKYRESIPARFFGIANPPFKPYDIWFHVCSLGESKAIAPLVERFHDKRLAISVITHTGYRLASSYPGVQVRYLPFELWLAFWIRSPKTLVVVEAEFWYLLFRLVHARGGRVIALNARISDRSFPKYYRFRWFYRRLFRETDRILCQSPEDMARFIALGATNVEVVGNIKLAQKVVAQKNYPKPHGTVIVAASTHEGEEEAILKGYLEYRQHDPEARLLVVPRHPERFKRVGELILDMAPGLTVGYWSDDPHITNEITLVDAMGELNNLYAISDIAILGGAFKPIGGHNPIEPATFGCKIITGKEIFLQKELFKYVSHVQFVEADAIASALMNAQRFPSAQINATIDMDAVVRALDHGDERNERKSV